MGVVKETINSNGSITIADAFMYLLKDDTNSMTLMNEDGHKMIQYMMNKSCLSNFKITINEQPGKTKFEPIKK